MIRAIIVTLVLVAAPLGSAFGAGGAGGGAGGAAGGHGHGVSVSGFGLRFVPGRNPAAGLLPFNYHGYPGYPVRGIWGGFGGVWDASTPAYMLYQAYGLRTVNNRPTFSTVRVRSTPVRSAMNMVPQSPATLKVQLPTAGEVWVNGKKTDAKPGTTFTLSSPELNQGQQYTFDVKARWEADGKTYEYSRAVTVDSGKRNAVQVLSGTPVN
jgi:uncharacterized protein (TIGR03000 family)